MEPEIFVNREVELYQIETALQDLRQRQQGQEIRLPVIQLCGVAGIGKTALLRQARARAQAQGLPALWVQAEPEAGPSPLVEQLLAQLPPPAPSAGSSAPGEAAALQPAVPKPAQVVQRLRALLHQHGAAVLLVDDLDGSNESPERWLEALLTVLGPEAPLLVVLTAAHPLSWHWGEPAGRPGMLLELEPLDRAACEAYLEVTGSVLSPEVRQLLLTWSGGYPLALIILTEAVRDERLNPRQPADRRQLLQRLSERVLRQRILGALSPEERAVTEPLLRLLAVPRSFRAMLVQELIGQFAPELGQDLPFAYFFLPRNLSARTHTLRWLPERAGYAVTQPVRHLLLLLWQEEEPARWRELQRWLAAFYQRQAQGSHGAERLHLVCEWLYHSALSQTPVLRAQVRQAWLNALRQESAEMRQQLVSALRQDQDLLAALGHHAPRWLKDLQALAQETHEREEKD